MIKCDSCEEYFPKEDMIHGLMPHYNNCFIDEDALSKDELMWICTQCYNEAEEDI